MFTCIFSLARTVGWIAQWTRDDLGSRAEDRPAAPALHGRDAARRGADRPSAEAVSAELQGCIMMKEFCDNSYLFGGNAPFVEELYERTSQPGVGARASGATTSTRCRCCPGSTATAGGRRARAGRGSVRRSARSRATLRAPRGADRAAGAERQAGLRPAAGQRLPIVGSRWATLDPLKRMPRPAIPELEPAYYDLTEADLEHACSTPARSSGLERDEAARDPAGPARDLLRHIGIEYMYISDPRRSAGSRSASRRCARRPQFAPRSRSACSSGSPRPRRSSATCTRATSARSASRSKAARA